MTIIINFDTFSHIIAIRRADGTVDFIENRFNHHVAVMRWMCQLEHKYHFQWNWTHYGDGSDVAEATLPADAEV